MSKRPICVHVRMAGKPSKLAVPRYPNIALIEVLVCNPLVHRELRKDGRFVVMLGCLKNRRKGLFRAILTLLSFGPLFTMCWSTGCYVKVPDLRPC